MKCQLLLIAFVIFAAVNGHAQTLEELKSMKAEKEAAVSTLKGEIADIDAQIDALPGWETGTFGTLGFNLSSFNNWVKGANPNAVSSSIRGTINGYANYDNPQLFWRNSGGLNLGWQKLDTDLEDNVDAAFEQVADILKIQSLFGYKFNSKLAGSALLDYNTSILSNFNNPGILDLGVGFTWTPVKDLVVVVHPLNYHIVLGDDPTYGSALGTKIVVDYTKEIVPGLTWKSNLAAFAPYKKTDPSLGEWTWTNGLGFNIWKGIGVGLEFGLRKAEVESPDGQNYWVVGLSYSL
ncbi:MAG: DUF3078 domain-containing protein [Saprospiraceae bacterium]|nr:DUF3078 domain-containing protein [Saprospiraceae bacterium]